MESAQPIKDNTIDMKLLLCFTLQVEEKSSWTSSFLSLISIFLAAARQHVMRVWCFREARAWATSANTPLRAWLSITAVSRIQLCRARLSPWQHGREPIPSGASYWGEDRVWWWWIGGCSERGGNCEIMQWDPKYEADKGTREHQQLMFPLNTNWIKLIWSTQILYNI